MSGFTRDEGSELQTFPGGRRAQSQKVAKKRETDFKRNPGRTLREDLMRKVRGCVPPGPRRAVYKYQLEEIIGSFWAKLPEEHRAVLTAELKREGFPAQDSGEASALKYCTAEMEKQGYRVSHLSKKGRKLIKDALKADNTPDDFAILMGPVFDRVVDKLDTGSWQQSGPLKLMGYKVGNEGLLLKERREILGQCFRVRFKPASEAFAKYVDGWGPPCSQQRLGKMIDAISRFISLAQKRQADCSQALTDWDDDLDWLRRASRSLPLK